jgi:DNA-binding response OmpR family regulator
MLSVGDLTLNRASREVHRGSAQIELTQKEFDVLEMLMEQPRRVLTREMILNRVWGYDFDGNTNVVDVYISYLRAKLAKNVPENDDEAKLIHTVRGVGFTLKP